MTSSRLWQLYGQYCMTISWEPCFWADKRPTVNVMGPPKDENRTALVLWCTCQKYRVPSMILLRCGCTHSHFEHLWTFISKLHSGNDYCGERHEKLWQRKVKHQLFFCTELSFQEKGYGFLCWLDESLMKKTCDSLLNQVILLSL